MVRVRGGRCAADDEVTDEATSQMTPSTHPSKKYLINREYRFFRQPPMRDVRLFASFQLEG